ncbi:MAG: hypothetical protein AABX70_07315 [Nanoarchaeota archaeon]
MKKLLLIGVFLLFTAVVCAYPQDHWVQDASGVLVYGPRIDQNAVSLPYSVLQAWHEAQRSKQDTTAVRTMGRVYDPFGLRLVKPLNIHKRYDRTAYTSVYGIDRQVIVPWQPGRVK